MFGPMSILLGPELRDVSSLCQACEIYLMQQSYGNLDRQPNPQTFALCVMKIGMRNDFVCAAIVDGFQLGPYVEHHNFQLLTTMCIGGQYTRF